MDRTLNRTEDSRGCLYTLGMTLCVMAVLGLLVVPLKPLLLGEAPFAARSLGVVAVFIGFLLLVFYGYWSEYREDVARGRIKSLRPMYTLRDLVILVTFSACLLGAYVWLTRRFR